MPVLVSVYTCGVARHATVYFFFFNDTATTEIYTLSLHDALPICRGFDRLRYRRHTKGVSCPWTRSEEHTSELQSRENLVCRLLLEKKKKTTNPHNENTNSSSTYNHAYARRNSIHAIGQ